MSNALVIVPRTIDEVQSLADRLSKATTLAAELQNKPANVLAAIMAGQELGFSPMAALRSVHIIKGIPKLSADAMVAAVLASGKAQYFEPSTVTPTSVTFVTKRVGSSREQSCTWSIEDAKRAGLVSDNHRLYPRQMLAARAKSELARSIYPDVLAGVYTEEEIPSGAADQYITQPSPPVDPDPNVIDAELVDTSAADALLEQAKGLIAEATSVELLKEAAKAVGALGLTGSAKTTANTLYKERMVALKTESAA